MKILSVLFGFFFCLSIVHAQGCTPLRQDELTRKGYSETVVFKEKHPRSTVSGTAVFNSGTEPVDEVFVEAFLFDKARREYKRVAGCRTSENGKFEFANLPRGAYKIVLSKDGGYKISEILLKVDPKSRNKSPIFASVEVGA